MRLLKVVGQIIRIEIVLLGVGFLNRTTRLIVGTGQLNKVLFINIGSINLVFTFVVWTLLDVVVDHWESGRAVGGPVGVISHVLVEYIR